MLRLRTLALIFGHKPVAGLEPLLKPWNSFFFAIRCYLHLLRSSVHRASFALASNDGENTRKQCLGEIASWRTHHLRIAFISGPPSQCVFNQQCAAPEPVRDI